MNTVSTETSLRGHLSNLLILVGMATFIGLVAVKFIFSVLQWPVDFDSIDTLRYAVVLLFLGFAIRPMKKPAVEHTCPTCGSKLPD